MIATLDDLSIALDKAPVGVLVLKEGRIAWINETMAELARQPKGEFLGRPLPETPLARWQEDVVEIASEADRRWFRRRQIQPLEDSEVHYFIEVTEQVRLKESAAALQNRLDALETTDPVTGLRNRRTILQELDRQISRSRRYGNPLAVIRLTLDIDANTDRRQGLLRTISQLLKDKLRWADEIGMTGENTFLLVLPETTLEDARELAVKLLSNRAALEFKNGEGKVRYGVTAWRKGDDPAKLLRRVNEDQEIDLSALLS